jgi:hypothetical protein
MPLYHHSERFLKLHQANNEFFHRLLLVFLSAFAYRFLNICLSAQPLRCSNSGILPFQRNLRQSLRVNGVKVRANMNFVLYQLFSWKALWFKKAKTMHLASLSYLNMPFQQQEHDISA